MKEIRELHCNDNMTDEGIREMKKMRELWCDGCKNITDKG